MTCGAKRELTMVGTPNYVNGSMEVILPQLHPHLYQLLRCFYVLLCYMYVYASLLKCDNVHCCVDILANRAHIHKVYTEAHVDFIRWTYYEGVQFTANKYSPNHAIDEMKLHGTHQGFELHMGDEFWVVSAYGQCTFSYKEELDHDIFRGWFMNIKAAFDKAVATARKRQVKTVHGLPALDLEEEEGGDDDD